MGFECVGFRSLLILVGFFCGQDWLFLCFWCCWVFEGAFSSSSFFVYFWWWCVLLYTWGAYAFYKTSLILPNKKKKKKKQEVQNPNSPSEIKEQTLGQLTR